MIDIKVEGGMSDDFAEKMSEALNAKIEQEKIEHMTSDNTHPKWGPKRADHPSIGKPCPICDVPFIEGDYTTLKVKGIEGMNAYGHEVHWGCGDK